MNEVTSQAGGLEADAGGADAGELEFVAELFKELDLTPKQQAYLAALPKYNWQLWSTVEKLGFGRATLHRWLQQENFNKARETLNRHYLESVGATYERTVIELSRLAYSDHRRAYRAGSHDLLPPSELDDDTAAAVQQVEVQRIKRRGPDGSEEERETMVLRLASKQDAINTLLKVHGKIVDKHEFTGKDGAPLSFGVMVVPGVVAEADWQRSAAEQQAKLAERERHASEGADTPS